ncbi:TonB-dependent receptor [Algibacter sp. 2305UL17-15]|uniref:SusC/RagA family TonB-linked outer membrane protein n=1 Tax=Algibacter sp. 2305UL17-15 TaxID=3231268 RepID=UPI00345ACE9A
MKTKFSGILTLLLAFVVQLSFAQEKTISGTVSDQSGLPLPGTTVLVKGTTNGTSTDFDGNYSIKANQGATLVYSFVGYTSQQVTVGSSNTINVTMKEDAAALEEVVVVAYGTTTKEAFTGSASVISSDDLALRPATSPIAAIEGKTTGVQFVAANGAPGSSPGIVIRGVGTLNGSTDPLFIVDGVQFEGALSLLNQDDIESMTVLKDAASTSLYGNRAANGVIIITTKSGKKGALRVNARSQYGLIDNAIPNYKTVNPKQYYELMWEGYKNTLSGPNAAAEASATIYNRLGYNPFNVPNDQIVDTNGNINPNAQFIYQTTDWRDFIERTGTRTNHSFNVAGGGENHNIFFSTSYLGEDGYVIESKFDRVTTRLNAEFQITDWLEVGGNANFVTSKSDGPASTGTNSIVNVFAWARDLAPIYPVNQLDANGNFVLDPSGQRQWDFGTGNLDFNQLSRPYNPDRHGIAELILNEDIVKQNNYGFRNFANMQIIDGLKLKLDYSLQVQDYIEKNYENNIVGDGAPGGRYQEERSRRTVENFNQIITYNKSFNDVHNFDVTLGHENLARNYSELNGIADTQTATGISEFDNFASGDNVGGFSTDYRLEGYFARLNYNFDNKYYLSGSIRRDGTSVFSTDVRWGNFYSFGASWRIDQESFMENVSFINRLKLRGSYGEVGNDNLFVDASATTPVRNFYISQALYTIHPNAGAPGIVWTSTGNTLLTWENQVSWDLALEFGLFNNVIDGTVEYFNKSTNGLLFNVPIPLSEGLNEAPANIGDMANSGFEVSLNANIVNNANFKWNLGVQATALTNEITKLSEPSDFGTKRWEEGRSRYDFYIYHYAGVDAGNGDALYYMWEDGIDELEGQRVPVLNANGTQATTNDFQEAGEAFANESSLPDLIGSVSNSFTYKNVSLDFLFVYGIGGKVLDRGYATLMHEGDYGTNLHVDALNAWRAPGDITNVPRLENGNPNQTVQNSTRFLTDASYLALRNVNISYNFNDKISDKIGVSNLSLFVSAENLALFSKRKGMNPQYGLSGVQDGDDFNPGRVISIGANVSF